MSRYVDVELVVNSLNSGNYDYSEIIKNLLNANHITYRQLAIAFEKYENKDKQ